MGASVQVTLAPEGATTDRLLLPGTDMGGGDDEDLTGRWMLTGGKVTISPIGPSILPFALFTPAPDQLSGERILSGDTLRLVLIRDH